MDRVDTDHSKDQWQIRVKKLITGVGICWLGELMLVSEKYVCLRCSLIIIYDIGFVV